MGSRWKRVRGKGPLTLPPTFKAQVTGDDIERGRMQDCTRCPVARSGRRALKAQNPGRALNVEVMRGQMDVMEPGYGRVAVYDHDGDDFINEFDASRRKEKPRPTTVTFTLRSRS